MTSLNVSKMFAMGGGKSLYINNIQPLRFSITAPVINDLTYSFSSGGIFL